MNKTIRQAVCVGVLCLNGAAAHAWDRAGTDMGTWVNFGAARSVVLARRTAVTRDGDWLCTVACTWKEPLGSELRITWGRPFASGEAASTTDTHVLLFLDERDDPKHVRAQLLGRYTFVPAESLDSVRQYVSDCASAQDARNHDHRDELYWAAMLHWLRTDDPTMRGMLLNDLRGWRSPWDVPMKTLEPFASEALQAKTLEIRSRLEYIVTYRTREAPSPENLAQVDRILDGDAPFAKHFLSWYPSLRYAQDETLVAHIRELASGAPEQDPSVVTAAREALRQIAFGVRSGSGHD